MRYSSDFSAGSAYVAVVFLLIGVGSCQAAGTAYLLGSLQRSNPANHTYRTLAEVINPPHSGVYDNIVLLGNYTNTQGPNLVVSNRNLSITSAPGNFFTFDLNFITGAVTLDNANITLHDIALYKIRRTTGQAIPFFEGEGLLVFKNLVRFRIGCAHDVNILFDNLVNSPRPQGFPGKQLVGYVDAEVNGVQYPNTLHVTDHAYFVGPADVGDFRMYAGYVLHQLNVSRACLSYTPDECLIDSTPDACLGRAIDAYLAGQAAGAEAPDNKPSAALIAGLVVAGVVVLCAAVAGWFLRRCRRRKQRGLSDLKEVVVKQLQDQSQRGQRTSQHQAVTIKSSVPIIRSGAAGTIEEVALGGCSSEWCMLACHSAPEFKNATPTDQISLGVLLGAGSFGRVYQGRWRGIDVAVKVLHHDSTSAAAVANEVDLVMSFRHHNIVSAFHFVTWKQSLENTSRADVPGTSTVNGRAAGYHSYGSAASGSSSNSNGHSQRARSQAASSKHTSNSGSKVTEAELVELIQQQQQSQQPSISQPPTPEVATSHSSEAPSAAHQRGSSSTISSSGCLSGSNAQAGGSLPCTPGSVHAASLSGTAVLQMSDSSDGAAQQQDEQVPVGSGILLQPGATKQAAALDDVQAAGGQQDAQSKQISPLLSQQQQQQQFIPVISKQAHEQHPVPLPALQEHGDTCIPWPDAAGQQNPQQQQQQSSSSSPTVALQPHQPLMPRSTSSSSSHSRGSTSAKAGQEAQTWLILEFCDGGTLLDLIDDGQLISQATGAIDMAHVLTLLVDIATGMLYLHSRNVLHGDLKPGNVMLKRQQGAAYGHKAMITDFGLSRCLKAGQSHRSTRTMGTVNHTPPELLRLGRLSAASDVYAFAIMMWELYVGKVAWAHMHYGEVFERVALRQERPPMPDGMPGPYAALMKSCWSCDPFQRPTFAVIKGELEAMLAEIVQGEQDAQARFVSDL